MDARIHIRTGRCSALSELDDPLTGNKNVAGGTRFASRGFIRARSYSRQPLPTLNARRKANSSGEHFMNKFISDLRAMTASELVVVLLTPTAALTLSAVFFLG